jgi:phenylacetic acid degradation operon negative regulatory protein
MEARSALFDLYGDHLRRRGGTAPVAALVQLLAPLSIAAPAVRTAISRMVRQGWLQPTASENGRGYALTERAVRRLDEAAARIYRDPASPSWDGCWSVAVVAHSAERTRRERTARALEFLGYRQLQPDTWIAPRRSAELEAVLDGEGLAHTEFVGTHRGDDDELVRRLYHRDDLASAYRRWTDDARTLLAATGPDPAPEAAFATRSRLVHEWRKFLFRDPGLPPELLPADWPGVEAARLFDREAARLLPAADLYVDHCLARKDA